MAVDLFIDEEQFVFFNTTNPVSIDTLISSLEGLKELVKKAPKTIENLTDIRIDRIEVFIEQIEAGSIAERLIFKLFFDSDEEYEKWLKEHPKMRKALMGLVLVGGVVASGFYVHSLSSPNGDTINISNNNAPVFVNSPVVIATSELLDKPAEEVEKVYMKAIQQSPACYIKTSIKFAEPVRGDVDAEISFFDSSDPEHNNTEYLDSAHISSEFLEKLPTKYEVQQQIDFKSFERQRITLHSTDRDKSKTGWDGSIDGVVPNRIKLQFADDINTSTLFGKTYLLANVEVEYRYDRRSNQMKPYVIFIEKLLAEE